MKAVALIALVALVQSEILYKDYLETDPFSSGRWVTSNWKQDSGEAAKFEWSSGLWTADTNHKGLRTPTDAKFYAASSKLEKTFDNTDQTLVLQFSVKHEQNIDCGGGYIKLLASDIDQTNFNGDTKYTIMFGPDICGSSKRVHAILHHNGQNLLKKSDVKCPEDEYTHFYTLIIKSDDTYEILVDGKSEASGKLQEGWEFEKPKMIKDPSAKKPSDWVDSEYINDPSDSKPSNWDDEPEKIADPEAVKPDDWDDQEDGAWEAPLIPNPSYKGEWKPKKIKNEAYKGPWVHPEIANPEYVEAKNVYKRGPIGAVGIEIWQVKSGSLFGDFLITNDPNEAQEQFELRKIDRSAEESAKKSYDDVHNPPPPEIPEDHDDDHVHDEF